MTFFNDEKPKLVELKDETFVTTDGTLSYLIRADSNHLNIQKKYINSGKAHTITVEYAGLEIQQSVNKNHSIKDAYMDYLSRHYILGCTKHRNYQGYSYLVNFIKPLMFDKIST